MPKYLSTELNLVTWQLHVESIATTREMHGPELAPSIELLGKKRVLEHLNKTLEEMGK